MGVLYCLHCAYLYPKVGKENRLIPGSNPSISSFWRLCRDVGSQMKIFTQHLRYVRNNRRGNIFIRKDCALFVRK